MAPFRRQPRGSSTDDHQGSQARFTPAGNFYEEQFLAVQKAHIMRDYPVGEGNENQWRSLPEIPTSKEILPMMPDQKPGIGLPVLLQEDPILPKNIVDQPWDSKSDYISTHYKLLREDGIAPLRESVAEVRLNPSLEDNHDTCVYSHVYIVACNITKQGPAIRVEFSTERSKKNIRWANSKRLLQGTMVALSPVNDAFKSICKIAVVADRPLDLVEHNPPQVDLFWGNIEDAELDPVEEYIMVEARSGYFEAYRHVLVAMQKLETESFPLSPYLVDLEQSIVPPEFVEEQPCRDLKILAPSQVLDQEPTSTESILDNVNILESWPTIEGCSLDLSQMAAMKRILTKKVAIIQGPPGTGKTFVSVSALKVIIANWTPGDPPMIVAAQTNHALDQILTQLSEIEPNFLRLGGRISPGNATIKKRTLYEVRNDAPRGSLPPWANRGKARDAVNGKADTLKNDVFRMLDQVEDETTTLLELGIITKEQFESLDDDEWVEADNTKPERLPGILAGWLGTDLSTDLPHCPVNNLGFEEEELFELGFEQPEEEDAEIKVKEEEDEVDSLSRIHFIPLKEAFTGTKSNGFSEKDVKRLLNSTSDLWSIPLGRRGDVYRYFRRQIKKKRLEICRADMVELQLALRNQKLARWQADATFIRRMGFKIIGCTTTGLSKYRGLLASLSPRIMLIEEAAEALEGSVLAANFETLQQLILVGDHQQLPAHCNISRLEQEPYFLSTSMFERLVNNGVEYTMLNKQRRMIPKLRQLLNPFYPELEDHPSVRRQENSPVHGMGSKAVYCFHHEWSEQRDETSSYFNIHEADMIVKFFVYLTFNGYKPSQITILTFYNGQRKQLVSHLKKNKDLKEHRYFNVFTVDAYQGEENDIVLLSLVRSNEQYNVGFLQSRNRTVVALSRARKGMYVFGNFQNLIYRCPELWKPVLASLPENSYGGNSTFPVVCVNHNRTTEIHEPSDWDGLVGGCDLKCGGKLPCGHSCPYNCHPFLHENIICKVPCPQTLPCGHTCRALCGEKCSCACTSRLVRDESDDDDEHQDQPPATRGEDMNSSFPQPLTQKRSLVKMNKKTDDAWEQPSLDDVLGDKRQNSFPKDKGSAQAQQSNTQPKQFNQVFRTPQKQKLLPNSFTGGSTPRKMNNASSNSSPSAHLPSSRPYLASQGPNRRVASTSDMTSPSRAWREWDAKEADRKIEQQQADERMQHGSSGGPVIKDIHKKVTIDQGRRVIQSTSPVATTIHRDASGVLPQTPISPNMKRKMSPKQLNSFDNAVESPATQPTTQRHQELRELSSTFPASNTRPATEEATLTQEATATEQASATEEAEEDLISFDEDD